MAGSDESPADRFKKAIPSSSSSSSSPQKPRGGGAVLNSILDDCDRPACDDMMSKLQQMSSTASAATVAAPSNSGRKNGTGNSLQPVQCPPSSGEIGTGSWNLLHSMAAWYPNHPTAQDRREMTGFFSAFARFYPCPWCAHDFQQNLQAQPVQTSSRTALCQWLCEQHNMVNEKLGKPLFPCDMASLDERWRKSSKEECQKGGGH